MVGSNFDLTASEMIHLINVRREALRNKLWGNS